MFLIALLFSLATPVDAPPVPAAAPYRLVVRSTQLDANGHANNARVVEYLQDARWDWLGRAGFSRAGFRAGGGALVVVHLAVDYRRELAEGDDLAVTTEPAALGEKSFTVRQTIRRGAEVVACGEVTLVMIDVETRRARPVPDALAALFVRPAGP